MVYTTMEPIEYETVLESWIPRETNNLKSNWKESLSICEKERLLYTEKKKPSDLWRHQPLDWFEVTFTEKEFQNLHVVPWPDCYGWGEASQPDGKVISVARRILNDDLGRHECIHDEYIRELYTRSGWPVKKPLILVQSNCSDDPQIYDGNHHTTAAMLKNIDSNIYEPVKGYVGLQPCGNF